MAAIVVNAKMLGGSRLRMQSGVGVDQRRERILAPLRHSASGIFECERALRLQWRPAQAREFRASGASISLDCGSHGYSHNQHKLVTENERNIVGKRGRLTRR